MNRELLQQAFEILNSFRANGWRPETHIKAFELMEKIRYALEKESLARQSNAFFDPLKNHVIDNENCGEILNRIAPRKEALAKDEQAYSDYVAKIVIEDMGRPFNAKTVRIHFHTEIPPVGTKLYTHAAKRRPLSEEEKEDICEANESYSMYGDFNETDGLGIANDIENAVYEKLGIK